MRYGTDRSVNPGESLPNTAHVRNFYLELSTNLTLKGTQMGDTDRMMLDPDPLFCIRAYTKQGRSFIGFLQSKNPDEWHDIEVMSEDSGELAFAQTAAQQCMRLAAADMLRMWARPLSEGWHMFCDVPRVDDQGDD